MELTDPLKFKEESLFIEGSHLNMWETTIDTPEEQLTVSVVGVASLSTGNIKLIANVDNTPVTAQWKVVGFFVSANRYSNLTE